MDSQAPSIELKPLSNPEQLNQAQLNLAPLKAEQLKTGKFNVEQFKQLYQTFNTEATDQLPTLYSSGIVFKDPIHQLKGINALTDYFASFCNPATHYQFEFINQIVSHDQAFFQ